jgi:hypothetical protein
MTERQRTEAKTAVCNMILGEEVKLPGRKKYIIRAAGVWPEDLCRVAIGAMRERLHNRNKMPLPDSEQ